VATRRIEIDQHDRPAQRRGSQRGHS
jgi:hypothetical protein